MAQLCKRLVSVMFRTERERERESEESIPKTVVYFAIALFSVDVTKYI